MPAAMMAAPQSAARMISSRVLIGRRLGWLAESA